MADKYDPNTGQFYYDDATTASSFDVGHHGGSPTVIPQKYVLKCIRCGRRFVSAYLEAYCGPACEDEDHPEKAKERERRSIEWKEKLRKRDEKLKEVNEWCDKMKKIEAKVMEKYYGSSVVYNNPQWEEDVKSGRFRELIMRHGGDPDYYSTAYDKEKEIERNILAGIKRTQPAGRGDRE